MSEAGIIYMLENQVNGKQYIGQTVDLNRRIRQHKARKKQVIDKAIDKYGWDNFEIRILKDNVSADDMDREEIRFIAENNTYKGEGYNFTKGGEGHQGKDHPLYGKHHSEEAKQKMSESTSGKNHPNYGNHLSKETKEKIRKAAQGRELSEKTKEKIRRSRSGKKHPNYGGTVPEDVREKIAESESVVTKEEAKEIKNKYKTRNNLTMYDLAEEYNIGRSTVGNIINENHWTARDDNDE